MGKKTFRGENITATYDNSAFEKLIDEVSRSLAPETIAAMDEKMDALFDIIDTWWPVKTGKSKAGFERFKRIKHLGGDRIVLEVGIKNDVEYVYYIKGNINAGKSSWVEVVRKPMESMENELAADVTDELKRLFNAK